MAQSELANHVGMRVGCRRLSEIKIVMIVANGFEFKLSTSISYTNTACRAETIFASKFEREWEETGLRISKAALTTPYLKVLVIILSDGEPSTLRPRRQVGVLLAIRPSVSPLAN